MKDEGEVMSQIELPHFMQKGDQRQKHFVVPRKLLYHPEVQSDFSWHVAATDGSFITECLTPGLTLSRSRLQLKAYRRR
jgi:hypothetical protein